MIKHKMVKSIVISLLVALSVTPTSKPISSTGLLVGGVGLYAGCKALQLTFRSERTYADKLCGLAKAGMCGTIATLCLIGTAFVP